MSLTGRQQNSRVNPTLPETTARTRTLPRTQKWPVMDKHRGHEAAVDKFQELIRIMVQKMSFNTKQWSLNYNDVVRLRFRSLCILPPCRSPIPLSLPQHVNADLYGHILCLGGSHLSPGGLLVVVHLVAQRPFPVDGCGLGGDIKTREKRG